MSKEQQGQHKNYAETGKAPQDETFGVQKLADTSQNNAERAVTRKGLKESERAHPKPRGYHVEPDHGPVE